MGGEFTPAVRAGGEDLFTIASDHLHEFTQIKRTCHEFLACAYQKLLPFFDALDQVLAVDQNMVRESGVASFISAHVRDLSVLVMHRFYHTINFFCHELSLHLF